MKATGDYELSDVPQLVERGGPRCLMQARAALVDAAGAILDAAVKEARALTPDESGRVSEYTSQAREISARLEREREQRARGLAQLGIAPDQVRQPGERYMPG